jgi:adenine-specific DNA-methyltransferase
VPSKKEIEFELLRKEIAKNLNTEIEYLPNTINKIINSLIRTNNRYGLIWEEKTSRESIDKKIKDGYIPYLKEIEDFNFHTENSINNILIEGNNYHSLKTLQATHKEKIDIIYIDPPYNTGKGDFKYNDTYIDKDDKYRHSKWLSFMEKRLLLSKDLLGDEGIIFISIDENECSQLKLLCDEIFDEKNYVKTIVWDKCNAQNDAQYIQNNHEYILVYKFGNISLSNKELNEKAIIEKNGKLYYKKSGGLTTGGTGGFLNKRVNLGYSIYYNHQSGDIIALSDYNKILAKTSNDENKIYEAPNQDLINKGYECIRPPKSKDRLKCWTWSIEKFYKEIDKIVISKNNAISLLEEVKDEKVKLSTKSLDIQVNGPLKSIISIPSSNGIKDIKKLSDEIIFENAKPVELIKYLIKSYDKKDAVILDFFAGSGTTGQAVIELNEEDEGTRQFILCTNNEVHEEMNKEFLIRSAPNHKVPKSKKISEKEMLDFFKDHNISYDKETYDNMGICKAVTYKRLKSLSNKKNFSLTYYKVDFEEMEHPLPETDEECLERTDFQEKYSKVITGLIKIKECKFIYNKIYENTSCILYENKNNNLIIINENIYKNINELKFLVSKIENKKMNTVYFFCPSHNGYSDNLENKNEFVKTIKEYIDVNIENIHTIPREYLANIIVNGDFQIC